MINFGRNLNGIIANMVNQEHTWSWLVGIIEELETVIRNFDHKSKNNKQK